MEPASKLRQLLVSLFSGSEIRILLEDLGGEDAAASLPVGTSPNELAHESVKFLNRRGLLDRKFFDELIGRFPVRAAEIEVVRDLLLGSRPASVSLEDPDRPAALPVTKRARFVGRSDFQVSKEVQAWRSRWSFDRLEVINILSDESERWLQRLRNVVQLRWFTTPEFEVPNDEWDIVLDLKGMNFMNARVGSGCFVRCDLRGARLTSACFTDCDFTGCDLRQAELDGAKFLRCNLSGARLSGSWLWSARFRDCDLSMLDWRVPQTVWGTSLVGCDLVGSGRFDAYVRDNQWPDPY